MASVDDASAGWQTLDWKRRQEARGLAAPYGTAGNGRPMIAGYGRPWQRGAQGLRPRRSMNWNGRERPRSVFKHFAIVEHFLWCTKSDPIQACAAASYIKAMADITNLNWISFLRCSIMNLSPLFSSKDRFSPLPQRAFFLPARPGRAAYAAVQYRQCTLLFFYDQGTVFSDSRRDAQPCRPLLTIWCTMHPLFV
jgi:hypothetical protein